MNTLLHYLFREDPKQWSDDKFAEMWAGAEWLLSSSVIKDKL